MSLLQLRPFFQLHLLQLIYISIINTALASAGELLTQAKRRFLFFLFTAPILQRMQPWTLLFQLFVQFPSFFGEDAEDVGMNFVEWIFSCVSVIVKDYSGGLSDCSETVDQMKNSFSFQTDISFLVNFSSCHFLFFLLWKSNFKTIIFRLQLHFWNFWFINVLIH